MKRFLLFMYDMYYEKGGMYDFVGDYEKIENALLGYEENRHNEGYSDDLVFHIYDIETRKIVLKDNKIND